MKSFTSIAIVTLIMRISTVWAQGDSTCIDPSLINPDAICPFVFAPVCGCDGVTYDNDCLAVNMGGVTSWTQGPCAIQNDTCLIVPEGVDFGMCEMVIGWAMYDGGCILVSGCGVIGSDGTDYDGYFFESEYQCNNQCDTTFGLGCIDPNQINLDIMCPQVWDPVCGCDGVTYGNDCEAYNWGGVTSWVPGECGSPQIGCVDLTGVDFGDCDMVLGVGLINGVCTSISGCSALVDGIDYSPYLFQDEGSCQKNCDGFIPQCYNPVQVDSTYDCIEILNPVCGCDDVTYDNSCLAFYAGVSSWTPGECETTRISELGNIPLTAMPNPFMDELNIVFKSAQSGTLFVMDPGGKLLMEKTFAVTNQLRVETNSLAAGMYFIRIQTSEGSAVFRAVKD